MMKHLRCIAVALCCLCALTACSGAQQSGPVPTPSVPQPEMGAGAQSAQFERTRYTLMGTVGGIEDQIADGNKSGFYQAVTDEDTHTTYIWYTEYASGESGWLQDETGAPLAVANTRTGLRVLAGESDVWLVRPGGYEWEGGPVEGGAVYHMQPDGSGLAMVAELPDNRSFVAGARFVYDGEGFYCNVLHVNGAKGTADVMLNYLNTETGELVEIRYYPLEGAPALVWGLYGGGMLLRAEGAENERVSYYRYNPGWGVEEEPLFETMRGAHAVAQVRERLYITGTDGVTQYLECESGERTVLESGALLAGDKVDTARVPGGGAMGAWNSSVLLCAEDVSGDLTYYRLNITTGEADEWRLADEAGEPVLIYGETAGSAYVVRRGTQHFALPGGATATAAHFTQIAPYDYWAAEPAFVPFEEQVLQLVIY